jgi:hypothetical protein
MPSRNTQHNLTQIGTALAAAVVMTVIFFGIQTSAGRFSASTSNGSNLWTASAIEVTPIGADGPDGGDRGQVATFLNAANIYPEVTLENCFDVAVTTSLGNVQVRAFASDVSSSGLQRYLNLDISAGTKSSAGCSSFIPQDQLYSGTLLQLGQLHGSFANGLRLRTNSSGVVQLRVRASVMDTNDAQGLSTSYQLIFEARP